MKLINLSILFLIIFFSSAYAQEVFVCDSYTEDGTPVGPNNRFEIKPYGTAKYILLKSEKKFNDNLLYLFIDKIVDGKLTPFDSKTITIEKDDFWAVTSYEFKEPGIYDLYFLNSKQNKLADIKVEVYFSEEFASKSFSPTKSYIGDTQITFCELVINEKPINPLNSLSLSRSGGQVFVYLNNYMPFNIDVIKVQIWKQSNDNSNYENLVDEKKYKLLPEWNDTFFKYIFKSTGEYKIDVLDEKNNFIASNIITVTK